MLFTMVKVCLDTGEQGYLIFVGTGFLFKKSG